MFELMNELIGVVPLFRPRIVKAPDAGLAGGEVGQRARQVPDAVLPFESVRF